MADFLPDFTFATEFSIARRNIISLADEEKFTEFIH